MIFVQLSWELERFVILNISFSLTFPITPISGLNVKIDIFHNIPYVILYISNFRRKLDKIEWNCQNAWPNLMQPLLRQGICWLEPKHFFQSFKHLSWLSSHTSRVHRPRGLRVRGWDSFSASTSLSWCPAHSGFSLSFPFSFISCHCHLPSVSSTTGYSIAVTLFVSISICEFKQQR